MLHRLRWENQLRGRVAYSLKTGAHFWETVSRGGGDGRCTPGCSGAGVWETAASAVESFPAECDDVMFVCAFTHARVHRCQPAGGFRSRRVRKPIAARERERASNRRVNHTADRGARPRESSRRWVSRSALSVEPQSADARLRGQLAIWCKSHPLEK